METPITIWLARYGVNYEGYTIIGAYSTRDAAEERLAILRELKETGFLHGMDIFDTVPLRLDVSKPLWEEIQALKDSSEVRPDDYYAR